MPGFFYAVVSYTILGDVVRADFFRALGRADLALARARNFFSLCGFFLLEEFGRQKREGKLAVLLLIARCLARHDNPRGQVRDANGGLPLIYILSARPRGVININFQLGGIYLYLRFFGFWQNGNRCGGGMNAVGFLCCGMRCTRCTPASWESFLTASFP